MASYGAGVTLFHPATPVPREVLARVLRGLRDLPVDDRALARPADPLAHGVPDDLVVDPVDGPDPQVPLPRRETPDGRPAGG